MFIINRKLVELYSLINNGSSGLGRDEEAPSDLRAYLAAPRRCPRCLLLAGDAVAAAGDVP